MAWPGPSMPPHTHNTSPGLVVAQSNESPRTARLIVLEPAMETWPAHFFEMTKKNNRDISIPRSHQLSPHQIWNLGGGGGSLESRPKFNTRRSEPELSLEFPALDTRQNDCFNP